MIIKELKTGESIIKPPISKSLKCGYVILNPGEEIGEHITENKEEVILVLSGTATIIYEGGSHTVKEKHVAYISEGKKHNVRNDGKETLKYVYFVSLKE